ncbi:OpgC family protein [Acidomonas methanolica]|uniref:OpgC protein n=1 Tax=Acidomonas methanolica NBRC 104435 TaxID=1231351 RepID=A0A023D294_ACIMT|nr:OpgC domain-containing protein [Acidomonas methanolica]MBU2655193.1 OpgC domain-containing protein [Acidomonas methanolica]TCS24720.1 hypothetical protein EDC31_12230 [Acidomonas methanolica]GAJ28247.1 hypothetical protein Amme_016_030 [Acidomonas methanolica NBRC 104435]GBQ52536.1 hypothetical protein AA0498_1764 [Acidomonas methanolica]GEK98760.1 OpgC protein [Acidomonas methanolica NBRC 104435]
MERRIAETDAGAAQPRKKRDHRVDALRGLALLMMLCDHVPQDWLNRLTLRNFGFADAAEIFVMLAGYASWLAYARRIPRPPPDGGWIVVGERILRRCWRLYLFQMLMLFVSIYTIRQWRHYDPVPVDFLEPELAHGSFWFWQVLTLQALPSNLNILPLYIVLLLGIPLMVLLWMGSPKLLLGVSFAIWLVPQFNPAINIPNWLDADGWYFNPLGWQFIFVLGMLASWIATRHGGDLPTPRWLKGLCWAWLLFGVIEHFPYHEWGLPSLAVIPVPGADKSVLVWPRWMEAMAILLLVQSSARARRFSEMRGGQALALLGRHSLEVFSLGTVLDLFARLAMNSFGDGLGMQVLVNLVGLLGVYGVAFWLERHRREAAFMAGRSRREIARAEPHPEPHNEQRGV